MCLQYFAKSATILEDIRKKEGEQRMAKKVAQFFKVSFEQFQQGYEDTFGTIDEEVLRGIYEEIKLPKRATKGSAGYDFYMPITAKLMPG